MKHKTIWALVALMLCGAAETQAQNTCSKTNSLVINTGIDATGAQLAYTAAPGTADPFWTITGQGGTLPTGMVYPTPAIVTTTVWTPLSTSPASNIISYSASGGATGYVTAPGDLYSLTFERKFTTCLDDSFQFNFDIACDNYIVDIRIDGASLAGLSSPAMPATSAASHYLWGNTFADKRYLTAGTHRVEIVLGNSSGDGANPTCMNVLGSVTGTTNSLVTNSSPDNCLCSQQQSSCNDLCYWRINGNSISGSSNIFGTLTANDVRMFTNGTYRGVMTSAGSFGWNTTTPTAKLHVDVSGLSSSAGIRFQGLPTGQDNTVVTVDAAGNLHTRAFSGGGIANACSSLNYVTKTASGGDLTCSQIYDNGVSVGIGTTGPFGYTGTTVVGTTPAMGSLMTLDVNGMTRSTTFVLTSDVRFKSNVTTLDNSLERVLQLRPVSYNWKRAEFPDRKFDELKHNGFIAQELQKVAPESVIVDEQGEYAVDYISIIPLLTQAIQQQQQQLDAQAGQIEALKQQLQQKSLNSPDATNNGGGYLAQNVPNPFSVATVIAYELPRNANKATIGVYDMNGKEIKLFALPATTTGQVTIQGGDLMPGMYLYTLIVDGKYFDSKKMVLTSQ